MSARTDFDILIVGGGLVGAFAAALAANEPSLNALRIALLEPNPPPPGPATGDIDLRVSAISPGSQRMLAAVDAWRHVPAHSICAYDDMHVWDAAGKPAGPGSLHFAASATSEAHLGYIVENRQLLAALYESAAFRNRVTLLRAGLAGLQFETDRVVVDLSDGRKHSAELVIGSDGASSRSRQLAGIDAGGWQYDQHAFVTHVRTAEPHRRAAWQRFLPNGPIAFLPLADGRSSIVWTTLPEHAKQLVELNEAQAAEQIGAAFDHTLGSVTIAGPRGHFPLRYAHARSYCRAGFVLIGDAAHAVHPLAGQGLNLGLLDAGALIEILAAEARTGAAHPALGELRVLRRYERWRRSENALAATLIDGLNRLFSTSSATLSWVRRTGLGWVDSSSMAKRFLVGRAMNVRGEVPSLAARQQRE